MASHFWSRINRDRNPSSPLQEGSGMKIKKKKNQPKLLPLIISIFPNNQPAKESLGSYLSKSAHFPLKRVLSLNKPSLCFLDCHVSSLSSFCNETRTCSLITKGFNSGTTRWTHSYGKVCRRGTETSSPF